MGDKFSDWEGVYKTFTAGTRVSTQGGANVDYVGLEKMTVSNSRISDAVDQFAIDDASFLGYISDGGFIFDTSTAKDRCVVNLFRVTPDSEKTNTDGTVIKIETGRALNGAFWDNNGDLKRFDVTLQSAYATLY